MHAHAQPGALVFRGECYGPHASHKILPTRRGCKPLPAPNRELAVTAADTPPAKMAKNRAERGSPAAGCPDERGVQGLECSYVCCITRRYQTPAEG